MPTAPQIFGDELSVPTPRSAPRRTAPPVVESAPGIDDIFRQFDEIEAQHGSLAAGFAKALVEREFKSRGFPMEVKSLAERQAAAAQAQIAANEAQEELRASNARSVILELLDDRVVDTKTGQRLSSVLQTTLGPEILDDPKALLLATNRLSSLLAQSDDPGIKARADRYALTNADLALAKISELGSAVPSQQEVQSKDLARRVKVGSDQEKLLERTASLQEGDPENPTVARLLQNLQAGEDRSDVDIGDGEDLFWDDFNQPKGAVEAVTAAGATIDESPDKETATLGILTGDTIGNVLRKVIRRGSEVGEDGLRSFDGNDSLAQAARVYVGFIDEASQGLPGVSRESLLRRMGIEEFAEQALREAQGAYLRRAPKQTSEG
jgi:hypothetical protein